MKRKSAAPGEVMPNDSIELAVIHSVEDDAAITNLLFELDTLEGISARMLDFVGCIFRRVTFSDLHIDRVHFANCRFEQCDLSGLPFRDGTLNRVEFVGCRGTGCIFDRMKMKDVLFKDGQLNYLTLSSCQAERIEFIDCDLSRSMFFETRQKDLLFDRCKLNESEFQGTLLKDVDLSSCSIENITLPSDLLRGATISLDQSPSILGLFGVRIRF